MRQGGTCGCITAALLVLGMALGFYDSQDREQEVYGNIKTEEFIRRFTEEMDGVVNCRDILGQDISMPDGMAEIRKEGLIMKKCPKAIEISIDILDDMLAEHFRHITDTTIKPEGLPENDEIQVLMKGLARNRRFRRNVNNLLFSSEKKLHLSSLTSANSRSLMTCMVRNSGMRFWHLSRASWWNAAVRTSIF